MSAKGRGVASVEGDCYPTPPWVTRRLLEQWAISGDKPAPRWTLEPFAGSGHIVREVRRWAGPQAMIEAWELRTELDGAPMGNVLRAAGATAAVTGRNSITTPTWPERDLIITNPPFTLAEAGLKRALGVRQASVAFLLRDGFLHSARSSWLSSCEPDCLWLPERPCYAHKVVWERHEAAHGEPVCRNCGGDEARKPCERLIAYDAPNPEGIVARRAQTDACDYVWCVWPAGQRDRRVGLHWHLPSTPLEERNEGRVTL